QLSYQLDTWAINQAYIRPLAPAKLVFDYEGYGSRISTSEPYRGKGGWLTLKLISVDALGNQEQHLLVSATTHDGTTLAGEDPEKLLRLPATTQEPSPFDAADAALLADVESRKLTLLRDINQRNLGYFEQELLKLDAWADDQKQGLEHEITGVDIQIKEVRRTAAVSPTSEENLTHQKQLRELEVKRTKLRRNL